MSIDSSDESIHPTSQEEDVLPIYEVEITSPYHDKVEKATFSVMEHAVRMAIACTALGALPKYPNYRPVVGVSSNQFKEDFGIYCHGDKFCIDVSHQNQGESDNKDSYGNDVGLLSNKAYVFYVTLLDCVREGEAVSETSLGQC